MPDRCKSCGRSRDSPQGSECWCEMREETAAGVAISSDSDLETPQFVAAPPINKDVSMSEDDVPCLSPTKLRRLVGKQHPPPERVPDSFNMANEPEVEDIPALSADQRRSITQNANHAAKVANAATHAGGRRTKKKDRKRT